MMNSRIMPGITFNQDAPTVRRLIGASGFQSMDDFEISRYLVFNTQDHVRSPVDTVLEYVSVYQELARDCAQWDQSMGTRYPLAVNAWVHPSCPLSRVSLLFKPKPFTDRLDSGVKLFSLNVMKRSALVILLCFALHGISFAQSQEKEPLGSDKWPTTVQAAVTDILSELSEKDKEIIRNTKQNDLTKYHFSWGMGIRNHYGLWRGNKKLIEDACGRYCDPDGASMKIIAAVWRDLQNPK